MGFDDLFAVTNISASGLSAERMRMEVVANNIANAYSTRTPGGGTFRRQDVVFEALLDRQLSTRGNGALFKGVHVAEVVDDMSELPRVYMPGHPDADADGFVTMPNVQMANEMVNLITANRAYEANLRVLQAFRQQADQALLIGKS